MEPLVLLGFQRTVLDSHFDIKTPPGLGITRFLLDQPVLDHNWMQDAKNGIDGFPCPCQDGDLLIGCKSFGQLAPGVLFLAFAAVNLPSPQAGKPCFS